MSLLIDHLRRDTRASHDAVEDAISLPVISSSREVYRRFLHNMALIWLPLEVSVMRGDLGGEASFRLGDRLRGGRLLDDLEALGEPAFEEKDELMEDPFIEKERSVEEDIGRLYVMEGSTLGGAQILKALGEIGVTAVQGGSFFAGHGLENGPMWKAFLAAAEERVSEERIPETVSAAKATFDFFEQNLHPDSWTR